MSRGGKIILGVVAGLTVLCVAACSVSFLALGAAGAVLACTEETNPVRVAAAAADVAEYDLPAGYEEQYAMSLLGFSLVSYTSENPRTHIIMMQFPSSIDIGQEAMERQMWQATRGRNDNSWPSSDLRTVGYRTVARSLTTDGYLDLLQVPSSVDQEAPIDLVMICLFITNLLDG